MRLFRGGIGFSWAVLCVSWGCTSPPHQGNDATTVPKAETVRLPGSAHASLNDVRTALPIHLTPHHVWLEDAQLISLSAAQSGSPESAPLSAAPMNIPELAEAVRRQPQKYSSAVMFVDVATPFRTLIQVMATLGWTNIDSFVLATDAAATKAPGTEWGWATQAPKRGVVGALSVFMVSSGFSLKLESLNVGANCSLDALGVAVPNVHGVRDYAGLERCARSILAAEARGPSSPDVDRALVRIAANPETPYLETIATIAALHAAGINAFHFGGQ